MRFRSHFEHALDLVTKAQTLDDLRMVIADLRRDYGLANIVYHAIAIPGCDRGNPILLLTYDPEWVRRYLERDYFTIDPVVLHGARAFLPLDWSDVDHETFVAGRFFAEADRFGVGRHGISLPIRAPHGERALLSITSNASEREWQRLRFGYMREFQLLAHFIHDRACQLGGFRAAETMRDLSRRERQCLQGIARGLPPKVIAAQLGVSDSAVRLYLKSARTKLRCATTNHAVSKAIGLEIIDA